MNELEEKTFSDRFNKSYKHIKDLLVSDAEESDILVQKFSNEIDKLISSEVDMDYKAQGIVVLALGGYGRKELCLKSDIDIMILHEKSKSSQAKKLAEKLLYKLWDTGLEVGNSLRTIDECLELASMQDSSILSSMMDLRAISGDSNFYIDLKNKLNKSLLPNISQNFINEKLLERRKRHKKYSTPSYLVEPDIKEGKGCLRDIHSCFWILRAHYCDLEINNLFSNNYLSQEEINLIQNAQKFFLKIRNHLHLSKNSYIDVIDFESQANIANFFKIELEDNFLTKENLLMRNFHNYTNQISDTTDKIIQRTLNKKIFSSRRIQNIDDFYIVHRSNLRAINPSKITKKFETILKPFEYSVNYNIEIADEVLIECKKLNKLKLSKSQKIIVYNAFLEILKKGKNLFAFINLLNKSDLIDFFIPEFKKIKNLALVDPSHIYTVDVHSIYLIKEFEKLTNNKYIEKFPLETKIAKKIKKKDVFCITALLHDIGKGYGKSHSERGAIMAQEISERLEIDKDSKELIEFLILEHLTMSSFSQKRDLDDDELIHQFKNRIKTIERLEYLFILTFCDLRSVAPDVWSDWKGNLLQTLFKKTVGLMSKKQTLKKETKHRIYEKYDKALIEKLIGKNVKQYLESFSSEEIEYQLKLLEKSVSKISLGIRYSQKKKIDQLTFWSMDKTVGFAAICGALSTESINVFSGRIARLKKDLSVYTLDVNRFGESTFKDRSIWDRINKKLLADDSGNLENYNLETVYKFKSKIKSKIKIDNDLSSKFSIIEITAGDKPGMLFQILKKLKEMDLRIGFVKISTKRESVEDSFYVRKAGKTKIYDETEIDKIKKVLKKVIT